MDVANLSITLFGRLHTALSRKACTFITSTGTSSTTGWKTWSCWPTVTTW